MPQIQITLYRTIGSIQSTLRIFVGIMKGTPPDHLHRTLTMYAETNYPGWIIQEYHSV